MCRTSHQLRTFNSESLAISKSIYSEAEVEPSQAVLNMQDEHSTSRQLDQGLRALVEDDDDDDDDEAEDVEVLRPPRTQQPELITLDELRKAQGSDKHIQEIHQNLDQEAAGVSIKPTPSDSWEVYEGVVCRKRTYTLKTMDTIR